MSIPRAGLLVCIALILGLGVMLLLRTRNAPLAPALELPPAPEGPREAPTRAHLEDSGGNPGAVELPPAPLAAPEPPAELGAEGGVGGHMNVL